MNEENQEYPKKEQQSSGNEFRLQDYLAQLWIYKYWILASVVVFTAIFGYQVWRTPPTYESKAELILLNSNGAGTAGNGVANIIDLKGVTQGEVNMRNEMEMMKSPFIMEGVVKRLNLMVSYYDPDFRYNKDIYGETPVVVEFLDLPEDAAASMNISPIDDNTIKLSDFTLNGNKVGSGSLRAHVGKIIDTPLGKVSVSPTAKYSSFPSHISIQKLRLADAATRYSNEVQTFLGPDDTSIIKLSLTDPSQEKATDILTALMKVYDETWIIEKNRATVNSSNFIKDRLNVIEKELSGIDENISQVKSANGTTLEIGAQTYYQQSSAYDSQEFEIQNQLHIASFLRDYLRDPSKANELLPSNSGINSQAVETQIQEYNKLALKRDNLLQNSSANNPVVAEMTNNLAQMRQQIVRSVDNVIATTKYRAKTTGDKGRTFTGKMSGVPEQEKQILSIERQQKVKENLYLYLLQKREENELSQMVNINNTRMLRASRPVGKIAPDLSKQLMTGAGVGLLVPLAIIFLLNYLDNKVNTRNDLNNISVPFLGEIPESGKRRRRNIFTRLIERLQKKNSRDDDEANLEIVVKDKSRSQINEAFRMIRTNLDFMTGNTDKSQVIMITSFNPGSGKTYIAMNLGKSLNLKNKKAIVVDVDLRRASLSRFVGKPGHGVTTYLTGKSTDIDSLIVKPAGESMLDVLPVGPMPPNPAELLLSPNFDRLIAELREKYDYVLLDCPPMGIVADTAISARVADLTIFIVRAGRFEKNLLPELEDIYSENKLPHMSVILNGIDMKRSGYGYRYGYGYGYTYGARNNGYYTEPESNQ